LKTFFLTIIALLIFSTGFSQKKRPQYNSGYDNKILRLGFTLGINRMNYNLKLDGFILDAAKADTVFSVEPKAFVGFNLGIIGDLRLNNTFNLMLIPGMYFGNRQLVYKIREFTDDRSEYTFKEEAMDVSSIHLDMPLVLKMHAVRINNYRPYLLVGASVKYDLEARKAQEDNDGYAIITRPFDYYYEFGFGINSYLPYFRLSTELKMCIGINDILVHEPTIEKNRVISTLKSKILVLSFHFE